MDSISEKLNENLNEISIMEMDRDQLLSFFYEYINKVKYLDNYSHSISKELDKAKSKRSNELSQLDKKYDSFYFDNLLTHEAEAKERLSGKKISKSKSSKSKTPKSKISTLTSKIPYAIILFFAALLVRSMVRMGVSGLMGILFDLILFGIAIGILIVGLLFFAPIASVIIMIFGAIFGGIVSVLCKLLGSLIGLLNSSFKKIRYNYVIGKARKKDILSAKKKGITKENIREKFGYDDIKEEINSKYDELERKIRSWNADEVQVIKNEHQVLDGKLLLQDKNFDYIIYMYNQLYIGANDNWKEAINDLKLQIRHDELTSELKNISKNISRSNDSLVKMNDNLNRSFAGLNQMISFETDRMDSRFDGIYDAIDYMYYY